MIAPTQFCNCKNKGKNKRKETRTSTAVLRNMSSFCEISGTT